MISNLITFFLLFVANTEASLSYRHGIEIESNLGSVVEFSINASSNISYLPFYTLEAIGLRPCGTGDGLPDYECLVTRVSFGSSTMVGVTAGAFLGAGAGLAVGGGLSTVGALTTLIIYFSTDLGERNSPSRDLYDAAKLYFNSDFVNPVFDQFLDLLDDHALTSHFSLEQIARAIQSTQIIETTF